jgi:Spy/CpxP family protein refolding chaperone
MKNLMMLVAVAALAIGAATDSFAQNRQGQGQGQRQQGQGQGQRQGQPPGQNREGAMFRMQEQILAKLNLTADQKKRVTALNKKTEESMKKLREAPGEMRSKMPKFREIHEGHEKALLQILTAQQRTRYQELLKQERERRMKERQQRQGQGGGQGGGQRRGGGTGGG